MTTEELINSANMINQQAQKMEDDLDDLRNGISNFSTDVQNAVAQATQANTSLQEVNQEMNEFLANLINITETHITNINRACDGITDKVEKQYELTGLRIGALETKHNADMTSVHQGSWHKFSCTSR